jgi:drug/metabolite transporter (DMT)-like permease
VKDIQNHFQTTNLKLGIAHYILATFLFSTVNSMVKFLSKTYPVMEILFFRSLIPLLILLGMSLFKNNFEILQTHKKIRSIFQGLLLLMSLGLMFLSFKLLPISEATVYMFTSPLFALLLGPLLLKEHVKLKQVGIVILGFIGVIIASSSKGVLNLGTIVGIGSAFCLTLSNILVRNLSQTEPPYTLLFWYSLTLTLGAMVPTLFDYVALQSQHYVWFLLIGVLGFFGQNSLVLSVKLAPVSIVAPFSYTGFVWAVLYGAIFFGESLTLPILGGAFLIIISGYLSHRMATR